MTPRLLIVFVLTELAVCVTPGPAVFLVVSQGLKQGFNASVKGAIGIEIGNSFYFVLSAMGLNAILVLSARLFETIRWLGVAYLVFLGLTMLLRTPEPLKEETGTVMKRPSWSPVWQGIVTQLINPKAIVYFTALLPQFITTSQAPTLQFVILGAISVLVELPVLVGYGWLGSRGGRVVSKRFAALPDRIAGAFLIGAGTGLALMKKQ